LIENVKSAEGLILCLDGSHPKRLGTEKLKFAKLALS